MKFINLKIETPNNQTGIPCELLLYIGKLSKNKDKTYLFIQAESENLNTFFYNALTNFVKFYKLDNISITNSPIPSVQFEILQPKLNMFFYPGLSEKNIHLNSYVKSFIFAYENMFKTLPFYIQENMIIDKYLFINDVVLQFGIDLISH